jgi:hypothetical protein
MLLGEAQTMKRFTFLAAACLAVAVAGPANAQLTGFVNNFSTNSTDWNTFVTGLGGAVNTNINFNAHPTGALQSNFYLVSDGVTLTPTGDVNTVQTGAGPAQGNTTGSIPGEGLHPSSNFLQDDIAVSSLTISFTTPVSGFGLFTLDYFNPSADNPLEIEAFAGQNGTGASLGLFSSVAQNLQQNNLYFMGLATTSGANSIGSVIFRDVSTNTGDIFGLDDFRFSRTTVISNAAPEPASVLLLTLGMAGFAARRRRKA